MLTRIWWCLVVCCGLVLPVWGQANAWQQAMTAGKQAMVGERYEEAVGAYTKAVKEAAAFPAEDARIVESALALAGAFRSAKKRPESEAVVANLLTGQRETFKAQDPRLIRTYQLVADFYIAFPGDERTAWQYHGQALAVAEAAYGKQDPRLVEVLTKYGQAYYQYSRYKEAIDCYQRALAIQEAALGKEHQDLLPTLHQLGQWYVFLGMRGPGVDITHAAESEACFTRALAVAEKTCGPESAKTADALNALAWLYKLTGDDLKAITYQERYAELHERVEPNDKYQPLLWRDLAFAYKRTGAVDKAITAFRKCLKASSISAGPDDFVTCIYGQYLADCYLAQERYAEAESLYKKAAEVAMQRGKRPGQLHPAYQIIGLVTCYQAQGKTEEAAPLIEKLKAFLKEETSRGNYGPNPTHLKGFYQAVGNFTEAERLCKLEITTYSDKGVIHPSRINLYCDLGELYLAWKKYPQAEAAFVSAVMAWEKQAGPTHPVLISPLCDVATARLAQGNAAGAAQACKRALAIADAASPTPGYHHLRILTRYADALRQQGHPTDADKLDTRRKTLEAQIGGTEGW